MEKYKSYSYNLNLFGIDIFTIVYDNIGGWVRIVNYGVRWTKKPLFSIRNGCRKSLKIKNLYITLLEK